jgi:hypothetical protein
MSLLVAYGAEAQHFSEFSTATSWPAGCSIDTGVYRTAASGKHGAASLKCAKSGVATTYQTLTGYSSSTGIATNLNNSIVYTTFWVKMSGVPAYQLEIWEWDNTSSARKAGLFLNTNGTLQLYQTDATSLSVSNSSICDGNWHCIQCMIGSGVGSGTWNYTIDSGAISVTVASGTTANLTAVNHGSIAVGFKNSANTTTDGYFDDITVSDSGFTPYDAVCGILKPSGADSATNTGYTASAGNKYDCVGGGPPPSDATYISSAVASACYTTLMQDSSTILAASDSIIAVIPLVNHGNHPSGGTTRLTIRSGSSPANTVLSTGVADAPGNLAFMGQVYEKEPIGNVAWSQALLDGLEVGCTEAAATSNCNEVYASVLYYRLPILSRRGTSRGVGSRAG